jgi:RNA polymerase sigma-70 factor (ECF subfamily)
MDLFLVQENQNIYHLLKGCLHNDRHSQKELYLSLRRQAYAICYRYIDNLEQIDQILNKSFVQLFKHIDQFNRNKFPDIQKGVRSWLSSIVVGHCIDYYRQLQVFNKTQMPAEERDHRQKEIGNTTGQPSGHDIIEAIRKLPPSNRIVFNLFVIEGMPHKEIGHQLGIRASWSSSILNDAREMIRKHLSGENSLANPEEKSAFIFSTPAPD